MANCTPPEKIAEMRELHGRGLSTREIGRVAGVARQTVLATIKRGFESPVVSRKGLTYHRSDEIIREVPDRRTWLCEHRFSERCVWCLLPRSLPFEKIIRMNELHKAGFDGDVICRDVGVALDTVYRWTGWPCYRVLPCKLDALPAPTYEIAPPSQCDHPDLPTHGTSARYQTYRCQCSKCRAWNAANSLSHKAKYREKQRQKAERTVSTLVDRVDARITRSRPFDPTDPDAWRQRARCRDEDGSVFFPEDGVGVVKAQRICAKCPVASECLNYALDQNIDHGIWGGKSERERRRIRRARRN